jgi:hypothetical protein
MLRNPFGHGSGSLPKASYPTLCPLRRNKRSNTDITVTWATGINLQTSAPGYQLNLGDREFSPSSLRLQAPDDSALTHLPGRASRALKPAAPTFSVQ